MNTLRIDDMNIIIRRATEKDLHELYEMILEFAYFLGKKDKITLTRSELDEYKDSYVCFLAESTLGDIVGYVLLFHTFHSSTGKAVFLDDLYVREEFRRLGVGKRLINAAVEYAKESGCSHVRWKVSRWNKNAIEMYKNLGARVGDDNINCEISI